MLKKALAVTALLVMTTTGLAQAPVQAQDYPIAPNSLVCNVTRGPRGITITCTAKTFRGGVTVTFTFFSDPVVLGTATAGADGVAVLTATVPNSADLGNHRIEATGIGSTGTSLTVTTGFEVIDSGKPIPRTGSSDTVPYATAGVAALGIGGMLLLLANRRRASHTAA